MDAQKIFIVIEVAEKIFRGSKHHSSKKNQNWPPISKYKIFQSMYLWL